jgi:alpha-D-xyloside xylohydrolase
MNEMKTFIRTVAVCIAGYSAFTAGAADAISSFQKDATGVTLQMNPGVLRLEVFAPGIIRVTSATSNSLPDLTSLSVVAKPEHDKWKVSDSQGDVMVRTSELEAHVNRATGAVSFRDPAGDVLLAEAPDSRQMEPAKVAGADVTSCALTFAMAPDEGVYGLGQHQRGVWNYLTSGTVRLAQANTDVGVPVISSSKGYMLFWDNPAVTTISPGTASSGGRTLRWYSEAGKAVDYYFCYGDGTIATAMAAYRHLTGEAPLMPEWELGFWQCKERYSSQEELLGVAKRMRDMKVPVDGIIQDWQYWPPGTNTWGSHLFDPARYPDPAGMFKQLHDDHFHALISVWAKFDLGSANSQELNTVGGMFPEVTRYAFPPGQGQWYDPFATVGRQTYWKQMRDQLFSKGVDGWWLDAPEPEIGGMQFRTYQTPSGPGYAVYNAYPLMHSMGIYQGQRAATDQKRVVILTRSAYAGQQRNSAITWSGDIQGTWEVLKNQIPAGLNFSLSGIPYWNTDTGGFFGNRSAGNGNPGNPQYEELFARWFQFSAFCPMFRVHGSYGLNPGKEIWRFDDKTQGIMRNYLDLRYRLLPYLYSAAWQVTSAGTSLMQPLVMDFPKDPQVLDIGNQYLFGPAILVTPVTAAGATNFPVYLPAASAPWYNFWTGETSPAGQRVDAAAPVETVPLFVKPGSIIPMGPFLQYSSEKPAEPIELRVYRGENSKFTLYEDEHDNYDYEHGKYATIPITWDEANHTLEIGKRTGDFPGMLKERTFNVVWVSANHGAGVPITDQPDAVIHYEGKAVKVSGPK